MSRSEMKRNARARLGNGIFQNRWMIAVLICIIVGAITAAAGSVIPGLGAIIVIGPMTYGMKKLFLKQARDDQDMDIKGVFDGFTDDFGGIFLLGLMSSLFILLWSLLLVIPGIVKTYAYELIYYVKADHPDYDWRTCLKESERLMKGHKWERFVLDLSFIGWYIVGTLCLGVGDLWVVPYHEATKAQFYLGLAGKRTYEHNDNDNGNNSSNDASWNPER